MKTTNEDYFKLREEYNQETGLVAFSRETITP